MTITGRSLHIIAALGAIAVCAAPAHAEEQAPPASTQVAPPLWELRVGATALYSPDYPGADESHWRGIGAPLFVYRGERLRIGGDEPNAAARAIAIETRRFELAMSVDAAFGADSDDNDARAGMPDLDPVVEIGPQLTINLNDTGWTEEGRNRLRLLFPIRAVGATDLSYYDDLGYVFQPALTYRHQWPGERRMSYSATLGATWASEGVQDYYYQVDAPYATLARPAYDADAGYMGAHFQLSAMREMRPGFNLYLTYRGRQFSGAANEDSPLHLAETTHAFSISAVWTAFRSSRPAQNSDQ
jgi:outer membrane scaffolding protein for murein synthesis (MipA/OmpV family)